jgi:hypothetical protein
MADRGRAPHCHGEERGALPPDAHEECMERITIDQVRETRRGASAETFL